MTALTAILVVSLVDPPTNPAALLVVFALIGWANVLVGALAWDRRPANRSGLLLCVAGLLTLAAAMSNVADTRLSFIGGCLAEAPIAAILHQVMAFPSGRLRGRRDVALVVGGYLAGVGLQIPRVTFSSDPVYFVARPDIVGASSLVQSLFGVTVLVLAGVVLVGRLRSRRRTVAERRSLAFVYGYGIGLILFFPFSTNVLRPLFSWTPLQLFGVQLAVVAAMPFVVASGILRGGFARTTEIEELGAWLGATDASRTSLRDALAEALGDPSVDLVFPTSDTSGSLRLVDAGGHAATSPGASSGRAAVEVLGRRGPVALIVYDRQLNAERQPVEAAGRVVALALEREQLTAELLASREAVRESRARIVEVGDLQRRKLAQDLHDLVQSRLVLAALHAGTLASETSDTCSTSDLEDVRAAAIRLRTELTEAVLELRGLVHGVMPALLLERGLYAAAEDLADRQPIPVRLDLVDDQRHVPPVVASTCYFILAEALSNTVKHSGAKQVWVSLCRLEHELHLDVRDDGIGGAGRDGAGLRGMRDRVEALHGQLVLTTSPGRGTRIAVELPCES